MLSIQKNGVAPNWAGREALEISGGNVKRKWNLRELKMPQGDPEAKDPKLWVGVGVRLGERKEGS